MPEIILDKMVNAVDGAEMILIPAGEFIMGSSSEDIARIMQQHPDWRSDWFAQEKPQRTVSLPAYWIYRYPVTVAQFSACCLATGWTMPNPPEWGWQDNHPMVNVSWNDVTHYANWAQVVIPTEAQWEKAARGVDGRFWPWGNEWATERCVNSTNSKTTQPVGLYPENVSPFGVHDMAGNAWNWCLSVAPGTYDAAPVRTPQRRTPYASGHVLRGGSFQCAYEAYLRCAYRCFECDSQRGHATYRRPSTGFRCSTAPE